MIKNWDENLTELFTDDEDMTLQSLAGALSTLAATFSVLRWLILVPWVLLEKS